MELVTGRKKLKFRVRITEKRITGALPKTVTLNLGTGDRMYNTQGFMRF